VDVQFVEHPPERAESHDPAAGISGKEEERDAAVLELGEVHVAGPRAGERRVLDGKDGVDVGRRGERFDGDGHARSLAVRSWRASRAISASGRRTYSGCTPAGFT